MKTFILAMSLLFLFSCADSSSSNSAKGGGDEGANAGDVYAQEVQVQIQHVVNKTQDMRHLFPEINMEQLVELSQKVKIYYREKTFVGGFETDAVNDGKSFIAINKSRWTKILNPEKKNVILLHELFGILGYEKDQYVYSSRLQPEFRYIRNARFKCVETPQADPLLPDCELDLVFDYDQQGFIIRNQSCRYFFANNQFYFRTGNSIYSHDGCRQPDVASDIPTMCSSSPLPQRKMWTTLTFNRDGHGFDFYSPVGEIKLMCHDW